MANSLILPLVFWHCDNVKVRHEVCALAVTPQGLVTGARTGELVCWELDSRGYVPRLIATPNISHECRQLVVLSAPPQPESAHSLYIVSLHSDNRVRVWDYSDGRCVAATPTSMFADGFIIAEIAGIPQRLVAIAGSEKSVHILDCWTMLRLCSYKSQGELVDLCCASMARMSRLAVAHGDGFVTVWDFVDNVVPTNPAEFDFQRTAAKLTMVLGETPTKVAVTPLHGFVAMAYERTVSFIHETWVRYI